jgi:hypothetical protein
MNLFQGSVLVGEGGHKEKGNEGMCFVSIYENRSMKPVEIVLRREGKKEGVNLTKIYCKHICKCHMSLCTTIIC